MTPAFRGFRPWFSYYFAALAARRRLRAKTLARPAYSRQNDLAAGEGGAAIVTLPAPGRYSVSARSTSGARVELIDMIAGRLEVLGARPARRAHRRAA